MCGRGFPRDHDDSGVLPEPVAGRLAPRSHSDPGLRAVHHRRDRRRPVDRGPALGGSRRRTRRHLRHRAVGGAVRLDRRPALPRADRLDDVLRPRRRRVSLAALRIWDGGLGIWGAVALGGVGAWIGCRRRGIPLPAFGDAIAPGIVLAQAIGRIGNYFNQELYGRDNDRAVGSGDLRTPRSVRIVDCIRSTGSRPGRSLPRSTRRSCTNCSGTCWFSWC